MPRGNGRGGPRSGPPRKAFGNRTDMNSAPRKLPVQAATNQPYGQAGQQIAAQQAVPLMTPGVNPPPTPPPAAGSLGAFTRESERPDEPLTAGLDIGAGPGSEVLGIGQEDPDAELRAIYAEFPSEDLRELLERGET